MSVTNLVFAAGAGLFGHITSFSCYKASSRFQASFGGRGSYLLRDLVGSNLAVASFATAYFAKANVYTVQRTLISFSATLNAAALVLTVCAILTFVRSTLYEVFRENLPQWMILPCDRGEI